MRHRALGFVVLVAASAAGGGCIPREFFQGNPLGGLMRILSADFSDGSKAKTLVLLETNVDVDLSATVGGLDGSYDINLDDPDGGSFGSFTGIATVKRGRFVTLKDAGSPGLVSTVTNLVQKALGESVVLDRVKAKVSAYQIPGGAEARWKFKVSFSGGVTSGENAGKVIKGSFGGEGVDPPPQ